MKSNNTILTETEQQNAPTYVDELVLALQRLDSLLDQAIETARNLYDSAAAIDLYRGLYVSPEEVERLLAREPAAPILYSADATTPLPNLEESGSRLDHLQRRYGLSSFEIDVILITLAPELDRRYERVYAYLQDHVSYRRPSIELVLNLLCPDVVAKLERRRHFNPDAPLLRFNLIHLIAPSDCNSPTFLAQQLALDRQIVRFLLHQDALDERVASFSELVNPLANLNESPLTPDQQQWLSSLINRAWETGKPLRLYFQGPSGTGKHRTAEALSGELGLPVLNVDLAQVLADSAQRRESLRLFFRAAWLHNALLYVESLDTLRQERHLPVYKYFLRLLADDTGITILSGRQPWAIAEPYPIGLISVRFDQPNFVQRRIYWQTNLAELGVTLTPAELDALAGRFRLTVPQIAEAARTAIHYAYSTFPTSVSKNGHSDPYASSMLQALFTVARAQSGHDLATLARKIEPVYTWNDIVLPEDALTQLHEMCQRVANRHHVLDAWGFRRKLSLGKGVNALFAGPSGTGKTMAAEIIATELGLDLYKIDLSGVVSKYIGETEKNLNRIFSAAENANAILFFDEADALFGKRSEVRDSHDRYANIEISYLLQKMEEYEGLSILATNLRQNMDDAFVRRLAFTIHFPFPDEASRRRIWTGVWPAEAPLADDVDLDFLARQFKLAGGNIKNIALAAAFLAVEANSVITMAHLRQAVRREYQKMGKTLSEAELNGN